MCACIACIYSVCICVNEVVDFRGHEEPSQRDLSSENGRIVVRFPGGAQLDGDFRVH